MFETDGYVIYRDVIDQDLIKEVNDHVEWLQARHPEVRRSHSVKLAWSKGAITRLGGNFDTWAVAWQTTHIRIPSRKPAANGR